MSDALFRRKADTHIVMISGKVNSALMLGAVSLWRNHRALLYCSVAQELSPSPVFPFKFFVQNKKPAHLA
jgi:hypothetical protein